MCAINGFNFENRNLIEGMCEATKHRGPDGTHIFVMDGVSFGHNRLSIIDPREVSSQPMESYDGKSVIIFNGEIYNYRELRAELLDCYEFKTKSDTEVILAAYKKWGKDCVKKFNGIFAFAIYDKEKKEIFLARDGQGVKPLYYYLDSGQFIFSSEIKAILVHPVKRILDRTAFNHYMRLLYVPEPLTMFKGIKKFPQSAIGIFKEGSLVVKSFSAENNVPEKIKSKKQAKKEVRLKMREAVERQMVSDRPLGIYLSGGIDSSVILDCVSRLRKNIDTFSVGFNLTQKEENEKFNADFNIARETSKVYGTNHHEILINQSDVMPGLEKAIWHLDKPVSNPTVVAMIKLAEMAKKTVDVVLTGDGGDELFGGYERYRMSLVASLYVSLPNFLRIILDRIPSLKKLDVPAGVKRYMAFMFQKDKVLEKVLAKGVITRETEDFFKRHYFKDEKYSDFEKVFMETDSKTWLVDEALVRQDKMSMANGLEARVPFLDNEIVELASRIKTKHKISIKNTKIVLKEAFKNDLPKNLFSQPKRGWFSPGAKWLRQPEILKEAKKIISPHYYAPTASLFDWQGINTMFDAHVESREYNVTMLWAILSFQIWAKKYEVYL